MVLVLWTDKIHETYGYLLASGVTGVQPPHDTGNNNRNALLRDPDGNLVELVTKSIGGTDQARGQPRQVVGIFRYSSSSASPTSLQSHNTAFRVTRSGGWTVISEVHRPTRA